VGLSRWNMRQEHADSGGRDGEMDACSHVVAPRESGIGRRIESERLGKQCAILKGYSFGDSAVPKNRGSITRITVRFLP
jgi:hypothetical protein